MMFHAPFRIWTLKIKLCRLSVSFIHFNRFNHLCIWKWLFVVGRSNVTKVLTLEHFLKLEYTNTKIVELITNMTTSFAVFCDVTNIRYHTNSTIPVLYMSSIFCKIVLSSL